MVYSYLLDLYQILAERKKEIEGPRNAPCNSSEDEQYDQGRLVVLNDFAAFLRKNYHAKLPRRMQKK